MAAKKARKARNRARRKAMTTSAEGTAAGGRVTEATAVAEDGMREVTRVVDSIDLMYRARQIDQRQHDAASAYRRATETLFSGYRCPLDQSEVGGGGGVASPTEAQVRAAARLVDARKMLGMIDGCVVALVVGEGLSVIDAARRIHGGADPTEREWRAVAGRLRAALDVLADTWFPLRSHGAIVADRKFDPSALLSTRVSEVLQGSWAHVTRSKIYGNTK